MAKVKVFLSFEFDRDGELYGDFLAQAARGDSDHDFEDCSLNEAYRLHDDSWKKKARNQIALSDIVIVLLGDDTHNAPSVEVEMTLKKQLYKPGFQIRPKNTTSGPVNAGGDVIPWDWKQIDAKIFECLELFKYRETIDSLNQILTESNFSYLMYDPSDPRNGKIEKLVLRVTESTDDYVQVTADANRIGKKLKVMTGRSYKAYAAVGDGKSPRFVTLHEVSVGTPESNMPMHAYVVMLHLVSRGHINFTEMRKVLCRESPGSYYIRILAHLVKEIDRLEREWDESIPPITALVFNTNGTAPKWTREVLTGDSETQPTLQQIAELAASVAAYDKWDKVLEALNPLKAGLDT